MGHISYAEVAKLVYALDLGSSAARRESSSLSFRTIFSTGRISASVSVIKGTDECARTELYCEEIPCRFQSKRLQVWSVV